MTKPLATVALPDGRIVDVFASGGVQVYAADYAHAYEIVLPEITDKAQTIKTSLLG